MRFILNFIFFGILFYVIWQYFPDAFNTMVSWAGAVVNFIKDLALLIWSKIGAVSTTTPPPAPPP